MNIKELLKSMVHDVYAYIHDYPHTYFNLPFLERIVQKTARCKYEPSGDIRALGLAMPGNRRLLRVVWHWKRDQEATKA